MFVSEALLGLPPGEAVLEFCRVINPLGNAFHSTFLTKMVEKQIKQRGSSAKFFRSPARLKRLVRENFSRAVQEHRKQNPFGPFPRQISWMNMQHKLSFSLQYITGIAKTRIQLTIGYKKLGLYQSELKIFGRCEYSVKKYAGIARIGQPRFEPPHIQQSSFSLLGYHYLLHSNKLEKLRGIEISLGQAMDLLKQYKSSLW